MAGERSGGTYNSELFHGISSLPIVYLAQPDNAVRAGNNGNIKPRPALF